MENVVIRARDDENKLVAFTMPIIYFLRSPKKESKASMLPSILGVDFIVKHNFVLCFDPNNRVAFLETT